MEFRRRNFRLVPTSASPHDLRSRREIYENVLRQCTLGSARVRTTGLDVTTGNGNGGERNRRTDRVRLLDAGGRTVFDEAKARRPKPRSGDFESAPEFAESDFLSLVNAFEALRRWRDERRASAPPQMSELRAERMTFEPDEHGGTASRAVNRKHED